MSGFVTTTYKRVTRRTYTTARSTGLLERSIARRRAKLAPVVLHQPGKVGSTSLREGIIVAQPGRPVYQVHHLTAESLRAEEGQYRTAFRWRRRIDVHLLDGLYVRRLLDANRLDADAPVITVVRDPMERRFSSFFQSLRFRWPDLTEQLATTPLDELADKTLSAFLADGWWHDEAMDWFFRKEFEPVWGLDVFDEAFDREAGFNEYILDGRRILVAQFELAVRRNPSCVANFVGLRSMSLPRTQVSSEYDYGALAGEVRSRLREQQSYVDEVYRLPEIQHFYSAEQLAGMRSRW